ncbi:hypothetical protein [Roseibium sp.]|uniref:hypothetical protein n=1 Tax=Roseibium sp. TaxID=1936156 RepID=UPI003D0A614A
MLGTREDATKKLTALIAAGLFLMPVAGCQSSGSTSSGPTSQVVRSSGQTAPTDLQLLCAAKTAEELKIEGGNVLPVSSMPAGGTGYQVNLTFEGGQATCNIDDEGNVLAITRV